MSHPRSFRHQALMIKARGLAPVALVKLSEIYQAELTSLQLWQDVVWSVVSQAAVCSRASAPPEAELPFGT